MQPPTRTHILDTAVALAERDGWGKLSVRGLSQAIGRSTMKLYSEFGSKGTLLAEVRERGFALLREAYVASLVGVDDPADRLVALGLAHVRFAAAQRAYYDLMFGLGNDGCEREHVPAKRRAAAVLQDALNDWSDDGDREALFLNFYALVHGTVIILREIGRDGIAEGEHLAEAFLRRFARQPG